jgi:hypothetical protein
MAKWLVKSGTHKRKERNKGRGQSAFRTYKKGDVFSGSVESVAHIRDCLEKVGPPDDPAVVEIPTIDQLEIIHKGFGKYVVVNTASGKQLNTALLSKHEAEAMVTDTIAGIDQDEP